MNRVTLTAPQCGVKWLTYDVVSKLVLCDVVEQRGEDRQQGHGGVVNVLRYAFHWLNTEKHYTQHSHMFLTLQYVSWGRYLARTCHSTETVDCFISVLHPGLLALSAVCISEVIFQRHKALCMLQ